MTDDERLVACFRHVFPKLTDAEIREARMNRVAGWDSAALLMLLFRVEREFKVRFEQRQINTMTSFAAMRAVLETMRSASRRSEPAASP